MDFILGLFLVYTALTAYLYINQRNMQYFPGGVMPELAVEREPEILTVTPEEGITLRGLYWPVKKDLPTIVFFHGNGQAYQYWSNKLGPHREEGYGVLFTDYRGYGGQAGKPTEQGLYKDARSFITGLRDEKQIPPSDMVFYGESLGTGVAIQMATEFRPKALILESAYSSTVDIAKGRYWMFPVDLLLKDQYRSIDKIHTLDMPKLFLHAAHDEIINIRFGKRLYEAAPEPKSFVEIPKGGHNNLFENGAPLHISSFLSKISAEQE